ncbi:MAG: hypothetical protein FJ088_07210 [Deltaproteobacteria bacterium]|nr:hypothetical protein [Deltaproteobacteria bacterium]
MDKTKLIVFIFLFISFAVECRKKAVEDPKKQNDDSGDPAFTGDYHAALSTVHMNFYAYNRAIAELKLAVEAEGDLIRKSDHMQKLAEALKASGKTADSDKVYDEIIGLFEKKAVEVAGQGAELYFFEKITEIYFKTGKKEAALTWAEKLLEKSEGTPYDLARFTDLMAKYSDSGDVVDLLKDMVKSVESRAIREKILIQITDTYIQKKRNYDGARKFLLEFMSDDKNSDLASGIDVLLKKVDGAEHSAKVSEADGAGRDKNKPPPETANYIPPPPPFGFIPPPVGEKPPAPKDTTHAQQNEEEFKGAGTPLPVNP